MGMGIDLIENKKELLEISTRQNEYNNFTTKKENEAKYSLKLTTKTQKDPVGKQSNRKGQTVNYPILIEIISQFRSEKEPRTIKTHKKGNKNSLQYGYEDDCEVYHSSTKESSEINGLTVEKPESGNQPLRSGYKSIRSRESNNNLRRYGVRCEDKKQLVPSSMVFLSLFLILTSNTMMCAEDNDISMNADTNEIARTNKKAIRREATGKHNK